MRVPAWLPLVAIVLVALSWIPLALIARDRTMKSRTPRVMVIPDMDKQQKYQPQKMNVLFADTRADRRPVEGTVARGQLALDEHRSGGIDEGQWATTFPMPVTETLMQRGHARYGIYCAPCHGLDGGGAGIVAKRADALQEGTWVPPSSLHDPVVRARPVGHIFNTITNGIRNMPPYGSQIPVADRWAIIAYMRALQRSQNARIEDVPPDVRPTLR
jgi:mono/diheme cytochrome c family protein